MKQVNLKVLEKKINEDYTNIAGIVILQGGLIKYENYFNDCTAASTIHVASVTKSIIAILFGIAIDRGDIESLEKKVIEFFPEYTIKDSEEILQKITIKDMMTMTAPYKYQEGPYIEYFTSEDWVTFSLDLLGGKNEIGEFRYAPLIGPDILSGILMKVTGQSVFDFAEKYLFTPLGIKVQNKIIFNSEEEQMNFLNAKNISGWVMDKCGTNSAGWGLTLKAMDMAKIGQLYLNHGDYNGHQIVSAKWVEDCTKEQSRWKELDLSYGYLWWLDEECYMAMGDGGNVIYVNPKKDLVVAIAALFKPDVNDRVEFIKSYIEPLFNEQ
ncbi:MAG: serine hydrolase domain-containing protein [Thomasclavelia sp.]|uniref:serine hydrolase domain-containing protein n=1 Tax=Thomasclavelia sp. TaxID=3025757 RepID=UPI0039A16BCA